MFGVVYRVDSCSESDPLQVRQGAGRLDHRGPAQRDAERSSRVVSTRGPQWVDVRRPASQRYAAQRRVAGDRAASRLIPLDQRRQTVSLPWTPLVWFCYNVGWSRYMHLCSHFGRTDLFSYSLLSFIYRVPPGHGKSWNLGKPFSRPGKSWKIVKVMGSHGKWW